jgi:transposase
MIEALVPKGRFPPKNPPVGEHTMISQGPKRVSEGASSAAVVHDVDSFAIGEPHDLRDERSAAFDNDVIGARGPRDLHLAGARNPADHHSATKFDRPCQQEGSRSWRTAVWTEKPRRIYRREGGGYPSDLRDAEWARLEPLIPGATPGGRPRKTDMRAALNAILYLQRTGCPWR